MNEIVDLSTFRRKREEQEVSNFDRILADYEDENHMFTDLAALAMADIVDVARELDIHIENNPSAIKDVLLCIEAIKGFLYRAKGETYPMNVFADAITGEELDVDEALEGFLSYDEE